MPPAQCNEEIHKREYEQGDYDLRTNTFHHTNLIQTLSPSSFTGYSSPNEHTNHLEHSNMDCEGWEAHEAPLQMHDVPSSPAVDSGYGSAIPPSFGSSPQPSSAPNHLNETVIPMRQDDDSLDIAVERQRRKIYENHRRLAPNDGHQFYDDKIQRLNESASLIFRFDSGYNLPRHISDKCSNHSQQILLEQLLERQHKDLRANMSPITPTGSSIHFMDYVEEFDMSGQEEWPDALSNRTQSSVFDAFSTPPESRVSIPVSSTLETNNPQDPCSVQDHTSNKAPNSVMKMPAPLIRPGDDMSNNTSPSEQEPAPDTNLKPREIPRRRQRHQNDSPPRPPQILNPLYHVSATRPMVLRELATAPSSSTATTEAPAKPGVASIPRPPYFTPTSQQSSLPVSVSASTANIYDNHPLPATAGTRDSSNSAPLESPDTSATHPPHPASSPVAPTYHHHYIPSTAAVSNPPNNPPGKPSPSSHQHAPKPSSSSATTSLTTATPTPTTNPLPPSPLPCTSPFCPLRHPHPSGTYLHRSIRPTKVHPQWGYSDPPDEIWQAWCKMGQGVADPFEALAVDGFKGAHFGEGRG